MDPNPLRSLAGFEALEPSVLRAAAARTRWLKLPARRWLVRPGRALSDHYYLLEGRVRLLHGGRCAVVAAASARARRPVYPGAAGLETLTPALFASVDPLLLAELRAASRPGLGLPEVRAADDSWQQRFLGSPLMQQLRPSAWQRVLRAMTRYEFDAGAAIVAAGEAADCCYVLCAGRADIVAPDGTTHLARLQPGDLFGEDALVTGGVRNASVVMVTPGAAVSLPAGDFERWLLEAVVRPALHLGTRCPVSLDPEPAGLLPALNLADLRAAVRRLPRGRRYAVIGGSGRERLLVSFLLVQRGIDARPLAT